MLLILMNQIEQQEYKESIILERLTKFEKYQNHCVNLKGQILKNARMKCKSTGVINNTIRHALHPQNTANNLINYETTTSVNIETKNM